MTKRTVVKHGRTFLIGGNYSVDFATKRYHVEVEPGIYIVCCSKGSRPQYDAKLLAESEGYTVLSVIEDTDSETPVCGYELMPHNLKRED